MGQDNPNIVDKAGINRLMNKGVEIYNSGRTHEALETFKRIEAKDPNNWKLLFWMSQCHYDLNSFYTAESYIQNSEKNLAENEEGDAALYELIGKINHRLGKVQNATIAYKKASVLMGEKVAKQFGIIQYLEQCEMALRAYKGGEKNIREKLSIQINSLEDEYAPIIMKHGTELFFTARRPETTGENLNPDDLRYFEDMYHATFNETTGDYDIDYAFFKDINTNGFDALSHIGMDGRSVMATINTSASVERTTKSSDIFEYISDEPYRWEGMAPIKSKGVNTDYFEGGATATESCESGDFMVFISDRKADVSGLDLFQCTRVDGTYGPVTSLSKSINTEGNETTPFVTADGKYLFFSSDNLPGFGGYDIYYCVNENGNWSTPMNLGVSVNTVNDDTHFRLDVVTKKGYFASLGEQEGFFSYDLFMADLSNLDFPFLK